MKKKLVMLLLASMVLLVPGCSKNAEPIQTDYVSIPDYRTMDVDEVKLDKDAVAEDVESEIQRLVDRETVYTDVEGRAVKKGDFVVVDYIINTSAEDFVGGPVTDARIQVGEEHAPVFAESLIGHSVGDTYTWDGEIPEDYVNELIAGTSVSFEITVKAIQTADIPKVDDAFASKVSSTAKTVDDLKDELAESMEELHRQEAEDILKTSGWIQFLDGSEVTEYPEGRIDQKKNQIIEDTKSAANGAGQAYEEFVQEQYQMSVSEWEAGLDMDVKSALKEVLVAEAVLKSEEYTLSEADYKAAFPVLMRQYGYETEEALRAGLSGTGLDDLVTIEVAKGLVGSHVK